MADDIELTVAGRVHKGWTEADVQSGLDSIADQFVLTLTERFPGEPDRFVLEAGAECSVSVGGDKLISGYIDRLEGDLTATAHVIRISGRSKTGDLVDCAAIHEPGSWRNTRLETIAADLAAPYGIAVTASADTSLPFKAFAIEPGETVFDAIARMCKLRGLLALATPDGGVEIATPVPSGAAVRLIQGVNILAVKGSHDVSQRFSEYRVKGQSRGDDEVNGRAAAQAKGAATDPGITRKRVKLIVAEDNADAATAKKRAEWEASVSAARAQEVMVTLPGWRTGGSGEQGALWKRGQPVQVIAAAAFTDAELIVSNVAFRIGRDTARTVELTCANPKAYAPEPVPEEAKASRLGGKK